MSLADLNRRYLVVEVEPPSKLDRISLSEGVAGKEEGNLFLGVAYLKKLKINIVWKM